MLIMKKVTILVVVTILFCSFTPHPDPSELYTSSQKKIANQDFVKAIGDLTLAISIKPEFGEAYLLRAKAKMMFAEKMGIYNMEYCYDLVQALQYGQKEAIDLLESTCDGECFGLPRAFVEPDMVFCADFSSKILSDLPKESEGFVNIVKLNLFNNRFSTISTKFLNLKPLLELDLSSNRIDNLGPIVGKLNNLDELNLNKNLLASLPQEIGNLTKLRKLYLRANQLTILPETITRCQNLEQLDLSLNKLEQMPKELSKLKNLKTLNLVGNNFDKKTQKAIIASLPDTQVYF
jgi:hypothetical protein